MKITDDDAAFILGKGGRTKEKISKVSGGAHGKGWKGGIPSGMLEIYSELRGL